MANVSHRVDEKEFGSIAARAPDNGWIWVPGTEWGRLADALGTR